MSFGLGQVSDRWLCWSPHNIAGCAAGQARAYARTKAADLQKTLDPRYGLRAKVRTGRVEDRLRPNVALDAHSQVSFMVRLGCVWAVAKPLFCPKMSHFFLFWPRCSFRPNIHVKDTGPACGSWRSNGTSGWRVEGYGFEMDVMKERARHAVPLRFSFKRRQELRLLILAGHGGPVVD